MGIGIFLMAGFNTVADVSKTSQSSINSVSTPSLKNGKGYNVNDANVIKNIINSKFNYYKIDNYSILSCNNILKVNINNSYYEVKWLINVIVNNKIVLNGKIPADSNDCYREYIW